MRNGTTEHQLFICRIPCKDLMVSTLPRFQQLVPKFFLFDPIGRWA
jgi:hypothetical protein